MVVILAACAGTEPHPRYPSPTARPLPPPVPQQQRSYEPEPSRRPDYGAIGQVAGLTANGDAANFLTEGDRDILRRTTQQALENGRDGHPNQWVNPNSGSRGTVVPQPRFVMNGRTCREYQHTVVAGGSTSTGYGTACRDGRGVWRIAANG